MRILSMGCGRGIAGVLLIGALAMSLRAAAAETGAANTSGSAALSPPSTSTVTAAFQPSQKPPPINQVMKAAAWRLMDVKDGEAMIEVMTTHEKIALKVGDRRTIKYARQDCVLEVKKVNAQNKALQVGLGDQLMEMRAR